MTGGEKTLLRLGGAAGLVAALWLPLFVVLFFGLLVALGLDPARFGEPDHVLPFFGAHPALIRLLGLVNVVGILSSGFFAFVLARRIAPVAPGAAVPGGFLTVAAWLLVLIAETLDLAAYVGLPALHARDPSTATLAFVTLQVAGRMTRSWGYLLAGVGIGMLGWGMLRQPEWVRGLAVLGIFGAGVGAVMFVLEYVFVTRTGDAGGGMAQAFEAMFVIVALILTVWHGWGGARLLKLAASLPAVERD